MRKKAFILPIVLIIFSIVVMISFSMYMRYINIYNLKNAKENELIKKFEKISFDEIFKTNKMKNFINSNIDKKEKFEKKFNFNTLMQQVLNDDVKSENFFDKYKDYKFKLILKQTNTNSLFKNNINPFPNKLFNNEIFIKLMDEKYDTICEYKFVDKNKIENYIIDTVLNEFLSKKYINLKKFYLNVEKNKNLYERIFTDENVDVFKKDVRFFNINKDIFYVDNKIYNEILKEYILKKSDNKNIEIEDDFSCDIVDLDKFFNQEILKKCSKKDFIDNYLIKKSKCLFKDYKKNIVNFISDKKIFFDFDRKIELYANFNIKDDKAEIYVTKEGPILKSIFVNNTEKNFNLSIEGILFSNKEISNYKFSPGVIDILTKIIKISDDYYIEKTDFNN